MGLFANNKGERADPVPEGTTDAVCYGVYDLGSHWSDKFKKSTHRVLIQFELPKYRILVERDGEEVDLPRAISQTFTLSLHEKSKLLPFLQSWRGKTFTAEELDDFDVSTVLGKTCKLQILHTTRDNKTYANIHNIMEAEVPLMPENTLRKFIFVDDGPNIPESTPDWIVEIIKSSKEWQDMETNQAQHQHAPAEGGASFTDEELAHQGPGDWPATGGDDDDLPF